MKILVLSKRHPMGRDLIERPYGRFFHLPAALKSLGHDVRMAVFHQRQATRWNGQRHGLEWISFDPLRQPLACVRELNACIGEFQPDWIFGFSDTYYGILAAHLARRHGARSMIDAYDNYASYVGWCSPLHKAWFSAVAAADLVTVAGPSIGELFGKQGRTGTTMVLPMAVDPAGFHVRDRFRARAQLGLPTLARYIGYFGSISRSRGITTLFDAWQGLRATVPALRLLLGGRLDPDIQLPPGVDYLGYLPDDRVPTAIACADAIAVVNRATAFGDYSYPIKLYEAMAMGIPAVASSTASTRWILRDHPQMLVEPDDAEALAAALGKALTEPQSVSADLPDWACLGKRLSLALQAVQDQARSR